MSIQKTNNVAYRYDENAPNPLEYSLVETCQTPQITSSRKTKKIIEQLKKKSMPVTPKRTPDVALRSYNDPINMISPSPSTLTIRDIQLSASRERDKLPSEIVVDDSKETYVEPVKTTSTTPKPIVRTPKPYPNERLVNSANKAKLKREKEMEQVSKNKMKTVAQQIQKENQATKNFKDIPLNKTSDNFDLRFTNARGERINKSTYQRILERESTKKLFRMRFLIGITITIGILFVIGASIFTWAAVRGSMGKDAFALFKT
ncbi:hypothetical protein SNEBB_009697 [Seison nebaliae]|nr:hypothetical protein SNEBB_009697 [Seison nebaliae]